MPRKSPLILVLLGAGTAPSTKIIRTGINDLIDSASVEEIAIAWHGQEAHLNAAFDVLETTKIPMFVYTDTKVPRDVSDLAEDIVKSDDYIYDIIVDSASAAEEVGADCKLALLWDDEDEELMNKIVLLAVSKGVQVLDLGNGLVPIMVEDDGKENSEAEVVAEVVADEAPTKDDDAEEEGGEGEAQDPLTTAFSRDELAAMPLASLKRMAVAQGKMLPAKPTKVNIIDILLADGDITPEVAQEMLDDVVTLKKEDVNVLAKPIVVVVYDNGTTTTITLSEQQQKILSSVMRY